MINYQPTQINKDRLLELEIGEEGTFIVPAGKHTCDNFDMSGDRELKSCIRCYPPLQKDDSFYIGEEFRTLNDYENESSIVQFKSGLEEQDKYFDWQPADQMQPHQSRGHYVVVDVECILFSEIYSNTKESAFDYINIVEQHNQIHQTNIAPSMNDYVFYYIVKRIN